MSHVCAGLCRRGESLAAKRESLGVEGFVRAAGLNSYCFYVH